MINIKEITLEYFEENLLSDYKSLFPKDEQRDWDKVVLSYNNGIEKFYGIYDNNNLIGFIMLEKLDCLPYYLDYLAIKEEYQNQGYGTQALKYIINEIIKEDGLCLEIEKVCLDNQNTIKRAKFYESLGFKTTNALYEFYNVLFTPYYFLDKPLSKEDLNNIMYAYYCINCGVEHIDKVFKNIE